MGRQAIRRTVANRRPTIEGPLSVLHVIDSLGGSGGAENRLVEELLAFPPETRQIVVRLFDRNDLDPQLVEADIEIVPLGLRSAHASYNWPLAAWRITRVIRRFRPQVVHTSLFAANLSGQLAAKASRVPVVSTMTLTGDPNLLATLGYKAQTARARALRRVAAWSATWSRARWRAVTDDTKRSNCLALGIPPDRVTVVYRGITSRRSNPTADRARFHLPAGPLFVNVARHAPQKGHRLLLEAFAQILTAVPNAQLAIAGSFTNLTPVLQTQADKLGIADHVHLLGFRDDCEVLLASGDVFVFSSLAEGMASAVLEAVVAEMPAVAFDIAPVREVTTPGQLATLVPVGDVDAFATAAVHLLSSSRDADALNRKRQWVLDHLSIDGVAARLEHLLRESAGAE